MIPKQPSTTARTVAELRAAHQILEKASIFHDPFAGLILDGDEQEIAERIGAVPFYTPARLFVAVRSRFAEDGLAEAVAGGVRQAVILGAGYDTFALRNPHAASGLRVFEVDHPDTQLWKRQHVERSGLQAPVTLDYVPVDFERHDLMTQLLSHGFRQDRPSCFIWLGVVPYLSSEAIEAVFKAIARLADAEVIFDYIEPLENYAPPQKEYLTAVRDYAQAQGEPGLTFYDPPVLHDLLHNLGFSRVEDLTPDDIKRRYFAQGAAVTSELCAMHVVRARL